MNLVVLSNLSPYAVNLIQQVQQHWPIRRIIRPTSGWRPLTKYRWSKFRKAPLSALARASRRRVYAWHAKRLHKQISRCLFGSPQWRSVPDSLPIPDWAINSPQSANLFRLLKPDLLLVCGAPLLKPRIFRIPKVATVNVHFGVSPHYRGEHTLFWPLYLGDYQNIGLTVHYIDEHVDTGSILAQGFPALEPTDTEATLWAKCARMAAELVVEFLQEVQKSPVRGQPQESRGQQFYSWDRTVWRDIQCVVKRRLLGQYLPSQPARGVRYFRADRTPDEPIEAACIGPDVAPGTEASHLHS